MKKNKNDKLKEIENLEKEISKLNNRLEKLNIKHDRIVQKNSFKCMSDFEYKKFNLKNNRIVKIKRAFRNCGDRSMKNDFLFVIAERYGVEGIFQDAGYGDDDTFAFVHRLVKYRICPKCGAMTEIAGSVKDVSEDWSGRYWSREKIEEIEGSFVPKEFDRDMEKVVFVGTQKECDEMFRRIG